MVGNVTIQGQIVGTATFDGAKISAVVTVSPPINATVVFGKSGVSIHNELTGRDAENAHPKESVAGLTISDSPEFANTKITTLYSVADGGVIPNDEANWLGATAKSVLSYLQKLLSKVYAINSRVAALEGNVIFDTTLSVASSSLVITTDSSGVALSLNEVDIMIIHPAMPTNEMRLQVNDIASNYYSYSYYNRSVFSIICGYYGGVITGKLMYDNTSRQLIGDFVGRAKYSTTQYTSYPSNGFIESPNMQNNISKLVFYMGTGQLPAGTRIVLKRAIR